MPTRKRLGDLLVESNLITKEQLEKALQDKSPDQKLGDALLKNGYITEQQLIEVLEFQLGIPHVSLYRYPFDTNLFSLIPKDVAKRNLIIPLKKDQDKLYIAMADPMDFYIIEDLRLATGFQIETAIATKDDILRAIHKYYEESENYDEISLGIMAEPEVAEEEITDKDSPIVRLVNQILGSAIVQRASDIHIDPHQSSIIIRFRVDGLLRLDRTLPKHMQNMLIARIKIMANLDITEHRIPQDGRIRSTVDFRHIDLRVSTLPTIHGEKIVMRILDTSSSLNDLSRLGFSEQNKTNFIRMIEKPIGIVLMSGPTGSGKSSTLYAGLHYLNNDDINIITIEDPVEFQIEGINQIQVNPNVGLTFASGLRAVLRQDPNIIMVGEIRDKETVEVAIRASLTGHLVLSTIHTNDSLSTITRLLDMGIEPFLVAASINGIVAQRLIRKVCRDCAQVEQPTKREIEIFAKRGIDIDHITRGKGCTSCNMTGYKGRIAIHEILVMSNELKKMIMNKESFSNLRNQAEKQGTKFLIDDGLLKVKQGVTTTEEVLRVTISE